MIFPPLPAANYAQLLAVSMALKEVYPYAPVGFQSGGETWYEGSGAFVCADPGSWNQVWNRHIRNEQIGNVGVGNFNPPPAVDFSKNLVVAIFTGPARGLVGYQSLGGMVVGKKGFLRLSPVVTNSRSAAIALPRPWAFLVLPRSAAAIEIQVPRGNGWGTIATVPPSL